MDFLRASPVCKVKERKFNAIQIRGSLGRKVQAVRRFIRVLPLPVPAILKTSVGTSGCLSANFCKALPATFCHLK